MRILVIHNQLWAHYKSNLFAEIHSNLRENYPHAVFRVVQIGLYESSRKNMQAADPGIYDYPYTVLFHKSLDEISFGERVKALFGAFSEFRPTVLNITGYYDWAQVLLMCYARLLGVKVVLSSESSGSDQQRSPLKEKLKSWIVNRANAYFCFGKTSVEYLLSLGVRPNRITVDNAAVIDDKRVRERYELTPRKESPLPGNFIFVGRFAPEKNLKRLLTAYQQAIGQVPHPWGLILVGDGPERKDLEEYITVNELSGVTVTGGVSWLEVPEWLAQADVLILPSYSEPWGLVVNEALVCGLPVVVSDKSGCARDLVENGKNGYTFDPYDTSQLTELLLNFMDSTPEYRKALGLHGQKLVSRFAVQKVAREMVETYAQLG